MRNAKWENEVKALLTKELKRACAAKYEKNTKRW